MPSSTPTPASGPRPTAATWEQIHVERAALAGDLARLDERQWATASLCDGLTVREVLAHMTAGASLTPARWMAGVIRCRFDFDRQVALRLAEQMGADPAETLARFRRAITNTVKPPLPRTAMLGETVVHAEDIRRPLGIEHAYALDSLTAVAVYYQGSDLPVLSRKRSAGLRLTATDGPFAAGEGPRVSGTTLALIMAMAGRAAYCDQLDGEGVATLSGRQTLA
ncbi:uncharacterized protein (TIGR03083 family) [Streptacidiphilus sp. MAP12-33]|uniref:maleylpyruvate isomerase family mycothiol-dependent enzyme n=1 Tax=Streptacidiphilus sp. MAP12-33 TaxID=3156266 RepID=UPI003517EC3C